MAIEHADRYGLATLHQLRGRVGRSNRQAYCLLIGHPASELARRRLQVILKENDGFKIAEEDLKLRGPGEIMGIAQHGLPQLQLGNVIRDREIIQLAADAANMVVGRDPELLSPENNLLRAAIKEQYGGKMFLSRIG
jgi:ATP-dependent DNA helicase RecG